MHAEMKTHCYKVILLGDSGVGKTTLFKKLKQKTKDSHAQLEERKPSFFDSLDITPCTLEFTLEESSRILLEVNDTGSVERYRDSVPTNYFRGCHGVVLVYDITNPTSLYDLEDWMTDAYNKTGEDSTITYSLIGNKLNSMDSISDSEEEQHFCEVYGISESLQFKAAASSESVQTGLYRFFQTMAFSIHAKQYKRSRLDSEPTITVTAKDTLHKPKLCFKC